MKKADVVKHFGNESAAAGALDVTKQAVNGWGEIVPEGIAYKAQVITGGALKVDPAIYRKIKKNRMAA
jgi:hypothetical protein